MIYALRRLLPADCLPACLALPSNLPACCLPACLRACLSLLCLDRSRGAEKTPQLVSRLAVFCCNVVQKSQTMTVSAGSLLSLLLLSLSLFLLLLPSMTSLHRALCDCRAPSPHATCHTHKTHSTTHTRQQPYAATCTTLPGRSDLGVGLMKVGAAGGHTRSERREKIQSGRARSELSLSFLVSLPFGAKNVAARGGVDGVAMLIYMHTHAHMQAQHILYTLLDKSKTHMHRHTQRERTWTGAMDGNARSVAKNQNKARRCQQQQHTNSHTQAHTKTDSQNSACTYLRHIHSYMQTHTHAHAAVMYPANAFCICCA